MTNNSIKPIIEELESLFSRFNEHYYNNELPKPVITLSPDEKSRIYRVNGWCTIKKVWRETNSANAQGYYEINICADSLSRSPEEISATLLHEMVHLYCLENDIQDVSRGGTYHNRVFKFEAEKHGLVVHHLTGEDYSQTSLSEEAKGFVSKLAPKFSLYRLNHRLFAFGNNSDENTTAQKQSTRKLVCPQCGTIVRVTKPNVHIICGDCHVPFMQVK